MVNQPARGPYFGTHHRQALTWSGLAGFRVLAPAGGLARTHLSVASGDAAMDVTVIA